MGLAIWWQRSGGSTATVPVAINATTAYLTMGQMMWSYVLDWPCATISSHRVGHHGFKTILGRLNV